MKAILDKLAQQARAWGGELRAVTAEEYNEVALASRGFSNAPFVSGDLGVDFKKKLILYVPGSASDVEPVAICHEMGHVFASRRSPRHCKEYSFLGWEYMLAMRAGISLDDWMESQNDYGVDSVVFLPTKRPLKGNIGQLSDEEFKAILEERIAYAQKRGLLTADRTPLAIR